jgi:hypothetical protein
MTARGYCRASVAVPAALAVAVFAAVLSLTTRPVETHPRITTTLLWAKDIAPILQRRCFSCHSPNNVAMSFTTYAEARPWAAAIREEVLTRQMPPWSAVAGYGRFENDPSLTQGEWDLLVAWVDGGAPSGQTLQEAEVPPVFVPGEPIWQHGEPAAVVKPAAEHQVAAGAPDQVQRFEIPTGFTSDQRVHGIGFKPGDRRVVRYASIFESGTNRWLFTWTPWYTTMHLPEGVAFTIKAGAKLTVEVGYRGVEAAASDRSEVGFYFDKASSGGVAATQVLQGPGVEVAPGGQAARTRAEIVLDETAALQAMSPEVGPGTTSLELTAILPDGGVRPLLWLREHRLDWPSSYVNLDPVPLPRGSRLVMTTYITNTRDTPTKAQPRLHLTLVPTSASTF